MAEPALVMDGGLRSLLSAPLLVRHSGAGVSARPLAGDLLVSLVGVDELARLLAAWCCRFGFSSARSRSSCG
jgi:hypothetical protein